MSGPESTVLPVTLAVAIMLAATYVAARRRSVVQLRFPQGYLSAAAGVSVAYVFMDILPELEERRQEFVQAMGGDTLFAEQRIYIAALIGFVLFYGLSFLVSPAGEARTGRNTTDARFWVHVGGYSAYSWLIGYLLIERAELGTVALVLYGVAMVLHLTVVGNSLARRHGTAFERLGAWMLAASVLAGWVTGVTVQVPAILFSRIFAFVAGGIVMTSMSEELPQASDGKFWWFSGGATVYALILLAAR